jgi:hypothetical protein
VTKNGADPLLSEEENTAQLIEPPTEEEMNTAITHNLEKIFIVVCSAYFSFFGGGGGFYNKFTNENPPEIQETGRPYQTSTYA